MGKILISHNEPRIYRAEGLVFNPGVNEVDEDALRQAGRNHLLRERFRKRLLTLANGGTFDFDAQPESPASPSGGPVMPTGQGGGDETPLAKLNATEAIDLVEQTVDRELLAKWLELDDRKTVKAAIEKQLATVQPGQGDGGDNQ